MKNSKKDFMDFLYTKNSLPKNNTFFNYGKIN